MQPTIITREIDKNGMSVVRNSSNTAYGHSQTPPTNHLYLCTRLNVKPNYVSAAKEPFRNVCVWNKSFGIRYIWVNSQLV